MSKENYSCGNELISSRNIEKSKELEQEALRNSEGSFKNLINFMNSDEDFRSKEKYE